jgi:exodeoxyribonuclease V beta subunit
MADVLVMTFTNAATAELVERMRSMLHKAVAAFEKRSTEPDAFLDALRDRHGDKGLAVLQRAAREVDDIEICTIHGFCRRILSQNAFETATPFDIDYVESDAPLLMRAAEDFWRRELYTRSAIVAAVATHAKWTPETFIRSYRDTRHYPDLVIEPTPPSLDEAVALLESAARSLGGAWNGRAVREFLTTAAFRKGEEFAQAELEAHLSALEGFCSGTRPAAIGAVFEMCSKKLEKKLKQSGQGALAGFAFAKACDTMAGAVAELELALRAAFIRNVGQTFEDEKQRAGAAGYDDLLHRVHAALGDPTRRGILKRTVVRQFRAVLIDEFQDTDTIQYEIFRELFADVPLLLIGDPKQAIYGFRGADVFAYLRAKSHADRRYTMDRNQRSESGLVAGVNGILSAAQRPFVFDGIDYLAVVASGRADADAIKGDDRKSIEWTWLPAAKSKPEGYTSACAAVKAEIVRLLAGDTHIGAEPVQPNDIAVLTRTNEQARTIQEVLREAGVPAVISRADNVLESEEAGELHALLRAVAEPRKRQCRARGAGDACLGFRRGRAARAAGRRTRMAAAGGGPRDAARDLGAQGLRRHGARAAAPVQCARPLASLPRRSAPAHESSPSRRAHAPRVARAPLVARRGSHLARPRTAKRRPVHERGDGAAPGDRRRSGANRDDPSKQRPRVPDRLLSVSLDVRRPNTEEPFLVHVGGDRVIYDCSKGANAELATAREAERLSEDVRLAYVALTRAKRRDYVALGEIGKDSAGGSPLAYLLNQPDRTPSRDGLDAGAWVAQTLAHAQQHASEWRTRVEKLCAAHASEMALRDRPADGGAPAAKPRERRRKPAALTARTFADHARSRLRPWRVASFSSFRAVGIDDTAVTHRILARAATALPQRASSRHRSSFPTTSTSAAGARRRRRRRLACSRSRAGLARARACTRCSKAATSRASRMRRPIGSWPTR